MTSIARARLAATRAENAYVLPSSTPLAAVDGSSEPPIMDLRYSPAELAFREEVTAFVRDNLPDDIRTRLRQGHQPRKQDVVTWQRILNRRGWATPSWPRSHGGPGWSALERLIFSEALFAAPAPEPLSFNSTMVGPVIIQFGSPAQKAMLPAIANLDLWFCQGFSEPDAGSDLASLRTTARRDGDHYVVTGQKIWTSTAHEADWMFCLVRTGTSPRRQEGISFLLIDMALPGITVRPIPTLDKVPHVNEVFLDEVRVPFAMLVGEENKGWDYAKFLLTNERTGIARIGKSRERLSRARELAATQRVRGGTMDRDPAFRERVALLEAELRAVEITQLRVIANQARQSDGRPDPFSSVLKLKGSELQQAAHELLLTVGGPAALRRAVPQDGTNLDEDWAAPLAPAYYFSRSASIYGGSSEIQKNILAKGVLGLS